MKQKPAERENRSNNPSTLSENFFICHLSTNSKFNLTRLPSPHNSIPNWDFCLGSPFNAAGCQSGTWDTYLCSLEASRPQVDLSRETNPTRQHLNLKASGTSNNGSLILLLRSKNIKKDESSSLRIIHLGSEKFILAPIHSNSNYFHDPTKTRFPH